MITKTLSRFRSLRPSVRSLVGLMWVYNFGEQLISIFLTIFIFQTFGTVEAVVWYFLIHSSLAPFSFIVLGFLWGKLKWNVRHLFTIYLVGTIGSFAFLYGDVSFTSAMIFSAFYGFFRGPFWVGMHSFELSQIHNNERDFYSSMNQTGATILGILAPALATGSFFLSKEIFGGNTFALLFLIIPIGFLFSLPFLKNLADYYPRPIRWKDITHFFREKKNFHFL